MGVDYFTNGMPVIAKTALSKAPTYVNTDPLKGEKERKALIDPGYTLLEINGSKL
ncbi:hypothetical protein [Lentibacillus cibarius]|uniref:hypothetical protein n=1 Tax=Lentibacillus cibarius TaxID=2583219 RepID=UPI001485E377|nr:hypothetical protein [Lentibacillus cibarius]